jgi:hypothetical protein
MSKKAEILAFLILVLGTCSMANAALSLVVGDGTTFTDPGDDFTIAIDTTFWVGIHDSIGEMYKAEISTSYPIPTGSPIEEADWTFNNAVYSPPAISTAPGWVFAYGLGAYFWGVDLSDPDSTEVPLPGVGCAGELLTLSEGSFYIYLIEYTPDPGFGPVLDSLLVNVVPEPTTILLLALGSLLLTRRRR